MDLEKNPAPRTIFRLDDVVVEVWCIQDLMDKSKSSSSTAEKARILPKMFEGQTPDFVMSFGPAAFLDEASYNGCVVVGTNIFIHNPFKKDPNPDSPWDDCRLMPDLMKHSYLPLMLFAPEPQGEYQMKHSVMLTITSLLSVLLFTFHLTDDIVHGIEPGTLTNLIALPIFLVWLYGTLVLRERRAGYVIMLLGGLFAALMPFIHMRGAGVGGEFAKSSGAFFFIWTLFALGVTGLFSVILAARALWNPQWGQSR